MKIRMPHIPAFWGWLGILCLLFPPPFALAMTGEKGPSSASGGSFLSGRQPDGSIEFLTGPNKGNGKDIALAYIGQNANALGLSQDASEELIVSDEVPDAHTGAVHIYLQQRISGIDVFNGVMNVSVAGDGSVMCVGNRLAKGSDKAAKTRAATLSPAQAVKSLDPIETPGGSEQKIVFSDAGISREPIPVRLVYQPVDDKNLRLAWEVKIFEREADHFWNLRVDAETGKVIGQDDYIDEAAYEVFAIPKQSPDAGGRTVELNPADAEASPYGWHDTDGFSGAEYTTTQGNNVHAYADRYDDDSSDPG
ncbi:MAG: M36 family metallopeptidase, partial [Deltaproteobacteria bacterium]|nr:M36 family metallopeptidase [Deltaproteobacteria bacterium]